MSATAAPPAAFFDVDGTLLRSNIVRFYLWYVTHGLRGFERWERRARLYASVPLYLAVDHVSRSALNRLFYRSYRGVSVEHFAEWSRASFDRFAKPRLFPEAAHEIAALRSAGTRIVLVTGAVPAVVAPIAEHFGADHIIANELEVAGGCYTGRMLSAPIGDGEKAARVREYGAGEGIDLASARAYADNYADLPMLEATGIPVAVNPDRRLARIAARRGWPVKKWGIANGSSPS